MMLFFTPPDSMESCFGKNSQNNVDESYSKFSKDKILLLPVILILHEQMWRLTCLFVVFRCRSFFCFRTIFQPASAPGCAVLPTYGASKELLIGLEGQFVRF